MDLVPDRSPRARGFYERLLVYLHVDGRDFNAQLVAEGYARVYEEGESRRKEEYLVLQDGAQAEGVGLWAVAADEWAVLGLNQRPPVCKTGALDR